MTTPPTITTDPKLHSAYGTLIFDRSVVEDDDGDPWPLICYNGVLLQRQRIDENFGTVTYAEMQQSNT